MPFASAHPHPLLSGITLVVMDDGRECCECLEQFDHPEHHI